MDRERRIPPFSEDAFIALKKAGGDTGDSDDGLPKDDAKALLTGDDRFPDRRRART